MSTVFGFYNLGNTCFLNAAVQCLLSLSCFKDILNMCQRPFSPALVFLQKCLDNESVANPSPVYDLFLRLNKNRRNNPEDAVECFQILLEYFEKNISERRALDTRSHCACYSFWNNQLSSSALQDIFGGIFYVKTNCSTCHHTTQRFELFQTLVLHTNTCSSIREGFIKLLNMSENVNDATCEPCRSRSTTLNLNRSLHKLPRVLTFEIIRNNNLKIDESIFIELVHGTERNQLTYSLKSVILYTSAHYTCICFDDASKSYKFVDDDRVENTSLETNRSIRFVVYEQV